MKTVLRNRALAELGTEGGHAGGPGAERWDGREQGEAEDERRGQVAEARFEPPWHPLRARGRGRGDEPGERRREPDQPHHHEHPRDDSRRRAASHRRAVASRRRTASRRSLVCPLCRWADFLPSCPVIGPSAAGCWGSVTA